jgi:2,3-bisphosphoglycerate-independent phosphoglycerate mutase
MNPDKRHILIILDGYGIAEDDSVSAIAKADKPFIDHLFATYPHATLEASGRAVGLPRGQMGNSEVGHMNLGAGRVVYQEITRIDKAIEDGEFFENETLRSAVRGVKERGSKLHLLGLFSDGGVHASIEHLYALLDLARREGLDAHQVCVHAFTDGRDTDPRNGIKYSEQFDARASEIGVGRIVSIVGRYYAMDRDRRWDRTGSAYRCLVQGEGEVFATPEEAFRANYAAEVTDEFIKPVVIDYEDDERWSLANTRIGVDDAILFFNFRADRARQLTRAFTDAGFGEFDRNGPVNAQFYTISPYDHSFECPVAFQKMDLTKTLGEIVSDAGGKQLRVAETEKYAHVTYFFSGGREEPFPGEERLLVQSPKVATYDLKPEMSAEEVARRTAEALATEKFNLVVLNFANPDMVGHTGVFEAAVNAVEAVDAGTRVVVEAALAHGYSITVLADHGNSDRMQNPDGSPHTAHTTVPVPHLIIKDGFNGPIRDGKLGDVAPTILRVLGLEAPPEMTGDVLLDL